MDESGPISITGRGEFPRDGLYNTTTKVDFDCTYKNGVTLHCITDEQKNGLQLNGTEGWIYADRDKIFSEPSSIATDVIKPDEIRVYFSNDHAGNFLDCIKSRQPSVPRETEGLRT